MLLRIGEIVVNTDQVREIYVAPSGEAVVVRFGLDRQVSFQGDQAKALIRWLDAHATNLIPETEMDEEWEAYKAKGGDMSRSMFEANVASLRDLNLQLDHTDPDLEPARWKNLMDSAARYEQRLLY